MGGFHSVPAGGSPAQAGIDPILIAAPNGSAWFPRTGGDRPVRDEAAQNLLLVPPHRRG